MKIDILTLFPEMFDSLLCSSIIGKAVEKGIIQVNIVNIRDFSRDKHRRVDHYPYGGGAGMVSAAAYICDSFQMKAALKHWLYSRHGNPLCRKPLPLADKAIWHCMRSL